MYGINEKIYNRLIEYFNKNKNIKKVILFGSRAKGIYKANSDIDICIDFQGNYKGTIALEIDELVGIYSCDIVFMDSLNEEIERQINRAGITIYERSN